MSRTWRLCLTLLAFNLILENAGMLTHDISLGAGILLLAFAVLGWLVSRETSNAEQALSPSIGQPPVNVSAQAELQMPKPWALGSGIALMVMGLLSLSGVHIVRAAGLAVLLYGLDLVLRAKQRPCRELRPPIATIAAYSVWLVFIRYLAPVWEISEGLSIWFSTQVSRISVAWISLVPSAKRLAFLNNFLILLAPTPTNISVNSLADIDKNGIPDSVAIAFAK